MSASFSQKFVSRIYAVAAKVQELDYFTRLNKEFQSELHCWNTFLGHWNGVSFFQPKVMPDIVIQTDASGSWVCVAFCRGCWLQWECSVEWRKETIMAKGLVPIVLSCNAWGREMARKVALFQCDNTGVVAAVKKGSAREPLVMHLLHSLWFFVAYYDIKIEHIAGVHNGTAEQISRSNMQQFFFSNPQANLLPTSLPPELLQIMSVAKLDWTSPRFAQMFNIIISKA